MSPLPKIDNMVKGKNSLNNPNFSILLMWSNDHI